MSKDHGFGVYIPVGPDPEEVGRVTDLVESLCHYEPEIVGIFLIEDGLREKPLEAQLRRPRNGWLRVIPHPLRKIGRVDKLGGLCTADLLALSHFAECPDLDFVVKFDTDALVIRPFRQAISEAFEHNPFAGMFGLLGTSCNRDINMRGNDGEVLRILAEAQAIALGRRNSQEILKRWRITSTEQQDALRCIAARVSPLLSRGYAGQHCQGGAYAVSIAMVQRMGAEGYLGDVALWGSLPFGEDRMMGLYCALVELDSLDLSRPHEPFGVQNVGLPYAPTVLCEMGYSIVHSLKNNEGMPEAEIRQFFRERRMTEIKSESGRASASSQVTS